MSGRLGGNGMGIGSGLGAQSSVPVGVWGNEAPPTSCVAKPPEHNPKSSSMLASMAFSSRLSRSNRWRVVEEEEEVGGAPGRRTLRKPSSVSNCDCGSSSCVCVGVSSSREKPPSGGSGGEGGAYRSWESSTGRGSNRVGSEPFPEFCHTHTHTR